MNLLVGGIPSINFDSKNTVDEYISNHKPKQCMTKRVMNWME